MELLIKNLGSIRNNNQAIDLTKKFYTFIGYNNSGKTLVSQLLWTIFNDDNISKFSENTEIDSLHIDAEDPIKRITINQEFIDEILAKFSHFIEKEVISTYNIDRNLEATITKSIKLVFKASIYELEGKGFRINYLTNKNPLEYIVISKKEKNLSIHIEDKTIVHGILDETSEKFFEPSQMTKRNRLYDLIIYSIIRSLLLSQKEVPFFIPASRSFFPVFYQYIYEIERNKRSEYNRRLQELIENIDDDVDTNKNIFKRLQEQLPKRSYTEPMNKVIESLYSLNTKKEIN